VRQAAIQEPNPPPPPLEHIRWRVERLNQPHRVRQVAPGRSLPRNRGRGQSSHHPAGQNLFPQACRPKSQLDHCEAVDRKEKARESARNKELGQYQTGHHHARLTAAKGVGGIEVCEALGRALTVPRNLALRETGSASMCEQRYSTLWQHSTTRSVLLFIRQERTSSTSSYLLALHVAAVPLDDRHRLDFALGHALIALVGLAVAV
jgi:hypothetical protein